MDHKRTKGIEYTELRCSECDKLLAKKGDTYEIKCTRCGTVNSIFKGIDEQVVITDPAWRNTLCKFSS